MGHPRVGVRGERSFACANEAHLSDDESVAKVGHPVVTPRSRGHPFFEAGRREWGAGLGRRAQRVSGGGCAKKSLGIARFSLPGADAAAEPPGSPEPVSGAAMGVALSWMLRGGSTSTGGSGIGSDFGFGGRGKA